MKDFRRWIGRRLVVNTEHGAFAGTLSSVTGEHLVLVDAQMLEPRGDELAGEIVLPGRLVTWAQVV